MAAAEMTSDDALAYIAAQQQQPGVDIAARLVKPVTLDNPTKNFNLNRLRERRAASRHKQWLRALSGNHKTRPRKPTQPVSEALAAQLDAHWQTYAAQIESSPSPRLFGCRVHILACRNRRALKGLAGCVVRESVAALHVATPDRVVVAPKLGLVVRSLSRPDVQVSFTTTPAPPVSTRAPESRRARARPRPERRR